MVDIKPSLRQRKIQEERLKRSEARDQFWKRREEEFRLMEEEERMYWAERRRFEEEMDDMSWYRRFPNRTGGPQGRFGPGGPFGGPHFMMRRPDTLDDRHCMSKHETIYPTEEELEGIQKIVGHAESALKKVSDHLAAQVSRTIISLHILSRFLHKFLSVLVTLVIIVHSFRLSPSIFVIIIFCNLIPSVCFQVVILSTIVINHKI